MKFMNKTQFQSDFMLFFLPDVRRMNKTRFPLARRPWTRHNNFSYLSMIVLRKAILTDSLSKTENDRLEWLDLVHVLCIFAFKHVWSFLAEGRQMWSSSSLAKCCKGQWFWKFEHIFGRWTMLNSWAWSRPKCHVLWVLVNICIQISKPG